MKKMVWLFVAMVLLEAALVLGILGVILHFVFKFW